MLVLRPWHLGLAACLLVVSARVEAQDAAVRAGQDENAAATAEPNMIELNFPEEVMLKTLVDYVGKRNGINFMYQATNLQRPVTLNAPNRIPSSALMQLLQSALKMHNMIVVPSEVPGMMHIEAAQQLTKQSIESDQASDLLPGDAGQSLAVTRIFKLEHVQPQQAVQVLTPFLAANSANTLPIVDHGLLIVTDYGFNMDRLQRMIKLVDQPGAAVDVHFIPIEHVKVDQLGNQVKQLLTAKNRGQASPGADTGVTVMPDVRSNRLVVVGTDEVFREVMDIIDSLDINLGLETKVYTFSYTTPEQIDRLTRSLIGELAAERLYEATIDDDTGFFIVRATATIHEQIESLREAIDKPRPASESPVRFYRLENADAIDVLSTLQTITSDGSMGDVSIEGTTVDTNAETVIRGPSEDAVNRGGIPFSGDPNGGAVADLPDVRVMAHEASNTIIVIATPSVHTIYEGLIRRLDVRQPQVLIEATVVILDTTDNFTLGVEIFNRETGVDNGELLTFSAFGLSTIDANNGSVSISPSTGFNGALLNADVAQVVIKALESDGRTRILSRPSVLVNDNATGTLASESEEPFTTTNVVAGAPTTTTFGGFATAGTNIRVTPQISQGDHLRLEYEITLSSFSGTGADGVPPPRNTDEISSEVTIPDGTTIVVGGLTRENFSEDVDRVPFLGRIPGLEFLFSSRSTNKSKSTLFVFLKASILRDDQFEDLRFISSEAAVDAELEDEYPTSEPLGIQ